MAKIRKVSAVALIGAVALTGLGAPHLTLVTAGLVLLGLGWSASSVAGATMLTSSLPSAQRVEAQGFTDALVSLVGAIGAATAGLVMGAAGYPGVGLAYGLVSGVAAIVVLALTSRSRSVSPEAAA